MDTKKLIKNGIMLIAFAVIAVVISDPLYDHGRYVAFFQDTEEGNGIKLISYVLKYGGYALGSVGLVMFGTGIIKNTDKTSYETSNHSSSFMNKPTLKCTNQHNANMQSKLNIKYVENMLSDHFDKLDNVIETPFSNYYMAKSDGHKFTIIHIDENENPTSVENDDLKKYPKLYEWYKDYFD